MEGEAGMGLIDEELVAAVAATAAAFSPRARKIVRKGAVYGLAGAMKAGDVVASAARGAVRGVQSPSAAESETAVSTPAPASRRSPGRSTQPRSGQAKSGTRSGGRASRATDGAPNRTT
jgi:hypothetical protein